MKPKNNHILFYIYILHSVLMFLGIKKGTLLSRMIACHSFELFLTCCDFPGVYDLKEHICTYITSQSKAVQVYTNHYNIIGFNM